MIFHSHQHHISIEVQHTPQLNGNNRNTKHFFLLKELQLHFVKKNLLSQHSFFQLHALEVTFSTKKNSFFSE